MSTELQKEYALRFARTAAYRREVWRILCREFFSRWVRPGDAVLDLGCGWGEFINQVEAGAKYGMDLNPDSPGKLAPGVAFLGQDCSEPWELPDAALDVVFTSNFFEHLPSKESLARTLAQAHRCLKPGGLLLCLGPNVRHLPGAYWDFWDHYLPLTDRSLQEGLELRGFRVETQIGRFLPYSMSQGSTPPLLLLRLYLRLPFLWPLAGKQFLLVARRLPQA